MDDELTHTMVLRFEAIEARLDALEGPGARDEEVVEQLDAIPEGVE